MRWGKNGNLRISRFYDMTHGTVCPFIAD